MNRIIDIIGLAVCAAIITAGLAQAGMFDKRPRPALVECYPAPAVFKKLAPNALAHL